MRELQRYGHTLGARIAALRRGTVDDAFMTHSVLPLLKERA